MAPLPKIYSNFQVELLRKSYLENKMSTTDIASESKEIFGIHIGPSTIYKELIRHNIPIRSISESVSRASSTLNIDETYLNEEVLEWIDGFNLGDGYINFNKKREDCLGARFCFGSVNKEWTDYSMSGLKDYRPIDSVAGGTIDKKHPRLTWSSRTLTHPDIVLQARRWYRNGKKIVPTDVRITPKSILLWYLGDGSISKMGVSFFIRLATCAFPPEEVENILISKLRAFGLKVSRDVCKNDIRISTASVGRFFEIIGQNSPISCYNYKFDYGQWLSLYRLSDVVKNNREKWRVQYLYKCGKLDCKTSPGGKLIMFTAEQRNKIRKILDNHSFHAEYDDVILDNNIELVRLSDIVKNDIEKLNAEYLIGRQVIKCKGEMLTKDQAELLRCKLDIYKNNSAIPTYMVDASLRKNIIEKDTAN